VVSELGWGELATKDLAVRGCKVEMADKRG
jgi:hypothetical protein